MQRSNAILVLLMALVVPAAALSVCFAQGGQARPVSAARCIAADHVRPSSTSPSPALADVGMPPTGTARLGALPLYAAVSPIAPYRFLEAETDALHGRLRI